MTSIGVTNNFLPGPSVPGWATLAHVAFHPDVPTELRPIIDIVTPVAQTLASEGKKSGGRSLRSLVRILLKSPARRFTGTSFAPSTARDGGGYTEGIAQEHCDFGKPPSVPGAHNPRLFGVSAEANLARSILLGRRPLAGERGNESPTPSCRNTRVVAFRHVAFRRD
jgi:hypothetical protein